MLLRPGKAGANMVADHIAVLTYALAQVPVPSAPKILIRVDEAGAIHGLLEHRNALNTSRRTVRYSVEPCALISVSSGPLRGASEGSSRRSGWPISSVTSECPQARARSRHPPEQQPPGPDQRRPRPLSRRPELALRLTVTGPAAPPATPTRCIPAIRHPN